MPKDILRLEAIDRRTLVALGVMTQEPFITLDTLGQIQHTWGSELFHFIPAYASYILTYTPDGTLKKETVLMDRLPFPGQTKVRKGEGIIAIQRPQSNLLQSAVGVHGGKLFIVTQIRVREKAPLYRYLDVYTYPEIGDTALYRVKLPDLF